MKKFKNDMYVINRSIATCYFGFSIALLLNGRYQLAAWFLFGVSILFMIGCFTQKYGTNKNRILRRIICQMKY